MKASLNKLWISLKKMMAYLFGRLPIQNSALKQLMWDIKTSIDRIFESDKTLYTEDELYAGRHYLSKSKLCTESDFHKGWFVEWCKVLGYNHAKLNRKTWEFVTITQALYERNMLEPGRRGLGFGVGREPLPALFASRQCNITASDIGAETKQGKKWQMSAQHLSALDDLYKKNICDLATLRKFVSYQTVDMNNIPSQLKDFDFTWSSCAFEHLGSIQKGKDFILNQMDCLKPGGWAIHTTEFNLTSNEYTIEKDDLVLFRRKDIEELIQKLHGMGNYVEELDTSTGLTLNDYHIDIYPYQEHPKLKLRIGDFITTSIILLIHK